MAFGWLQSEHFEIAAGLQLKSIANHQFAAGLPDRLPVETQVPGSNLCDHLGAGEAETGRGDGIEPEGCLNGVKSSGGPLSRQL